MELSVIIHKIAIPGVSDDHCTVPFPLTVKIPSGTQRRLRLGIAEPLSGSGHFGYYSSNVRTSQFFMLKERNSSSVISTK